MVSTNSDEPRLERVHSVTGKRIGWSWYCPGHQDCGPIFPRKSEALADMDAHEKPTANALVTDERTEK